MSTDRRSEEFAEAHHAAGHGEEQERLISAVAAAGEYLRDTLHGEAGAGPRRYLQERGFGEVLESDRWAIGYASPTWTGLTTHLRGLGYTQHELVQSGLSLVLRRGTLIDHFRDRITFGVRDPTGTLVSFTGRCAPLAASSCPKYINGPRTALYDKSATLFGLAEQRERLSSRATPVIVEGPLDAIAVYLAARDEFAAVSPCGSALTAAQSALLKSHSRNHVVVAFDADVAGTRASISTYGILARHFAEVSAPDLPPGKDPAMVLSSTTGPSDLRRALETQQPLADLVTDAAIRPWIGHLDNAEASVAALKSGARAIGSLAPGAVARQAGRLATILNFDHALVTHELVEALQSGLQTHPQLGAYPLRAVQPRRHSGVRPLIHVHNLSARRAQSHSPSAGPH